MSCCPLTWYLGDSSRGGVVREEKWFPAPHYNFSSVTEESSGIYRHLVEAHTCQTAPHQRKN